LLAIASLGTPDVSFGQRIAEGFHYDPPTEARLDDEGANARLLTWWQNPRGSRSSELYFRNTSNRTIEISSYEFFNCTNVIGVTCGEKQKGPRLEPGQTLRVETVRQRDFEQRWSIDVRFQARFLGPTPAGNTSPNVTEESQPRDPPRTTGWIPERYDYVDRVMPMLMRNHSVPGVAIVLVEGPTVQWAAGYGVADESGEAVTPRTVFRVGALAEPVIALALHRLSVERAWNVESPVTTWAHTETIPAGLESASAADMLAHATSIPARSYALLQKIVELSEGHDLQVLIRAMVIQPHHLASMSFMPLASGGMARGHDRSGQPVLPAPVDDDDVSGALFSSASDYARFLVEASPLSRRDPATWRRLVRPHRELRGDHSLAWGLGWIVAKARDDSPIVFRTGKAPGYTSFALVDETRQRALVILTNGDGGLDLTEDVLGFLDPWSDPIVEAYLHGG
jgi:CubicO group peptidase (beta-lactamase class C family)